jgi:hypothetical protein
VYSAHISQNSYDIEDGLKLENDTYKDLHKKPAKIIIETTVLTHKSINTKYDRQ